MTDIVERLRRLGSDSVGNYGMPIANEAADEIERNRAAIAELVGALKWIADVNAMDYEYQRVARAAITKHEQPEQTISERHAHGVFW